MLSLLCLATLVAVASGACNIACPMNWDPLCGSDGHTYANSCEMVSMNCLNRRSVTIAHRGMCVELCEKVCTMNWSPVCGSDGKTYGNRCQLSSMSCAAKKNVALAYEGECKQVSAKRSCNGICTRQWQPVCGTDGRTYGNPCELTNMACRRSDNLAIAYSGECKMTKKTACNIACTRNWAPVCGTDGNTYGNQCDLTSLACQQRSGLAVAYTGECQVCQLACPRNWAPVCGSDGKTYANQCDLKSISCRSKSGVTVAKAGEC